MSEPRTVLQKGREKNAEGLRRAAEADSAQTISFAESTHAVQTPEQPSHNDAQTVLANTPFLLTRCSSDLRYIFVSEAYARMLGHRPEDLIGKKIIDVIGEVAFQTILPDMNAVLAGRRVEYEKEIHYKGTAPRLVHVIYTPDKDESGHVVGWIASIIDITDAADVHATMLLRDVGSECVRDDATLNHCLHLIMDAGIVIAKAQKGTLQDSIHRQGPYGSPPNVGLNSSSLISLKTPASRLRLAVPPSNAAVALLLRMY